MMLRQNILTLLIATALISSASGCNHSQDHDEGGVTSPNKEAPNQTPGRTNQGPSPSQDPGVTVKGRSLQILKKPNSTDLSFGVVYTLDSDQNGMAWQITYKTDITDAELKSLPETMYWNVHYKIGEKPRIDAFDAEDFAIDKSRLRLGQMKLTKPKKVLAEIILMQQDGFLTFGTSPLGALNNPKFVINLGDLCRTSPEYFSNNTNTKKCYEINLDDVGLK